MLSQPVPCCLDKLISICCYGHFGANTLIDNSIVICEVLEIEDWLTDSERALRSDCTSLGFQRRNVHMTVPFRHVPTFL